MTLQQIEYVLEIVRCGSISGAARNLFISQPYLSGVLRDLEGEIGIEIFKRTSRGIEITKEGREFISYIKPLVDQKEKIMDIYKGNKENPAMSFSVSLQHFPFIIKAFIDFYNEKKPENFNCHIKETGMYQAMNDVFEKKSDIAIIYMAETTEAFILKTLSNKGLEFIPINALTPHVYIGENHPMASADKISLKELQPYPFISFEGDNALSLDYSEEILFAGFSPGQKRFFIDDRATMYNLLAHTNGYSIGSGILPPDYAHKIISKPISDRNELLTLGYVKLIDKNLDAAAEAFISHVKNNI